ncbi:hypothetical protein ACO0LV_18260 [Pseudactinotalea sp. Z1739]|uniref:hypothetical protein n=1 Tax=Pseudactinotalea sp. Z1739 TaxID=3413028 RepID=UPI003C7D8164
MANVDHDAVVCEMAVLTELRSNRRSADAASAAVPERRARACPKRRNYHRVVAAVTVLFFLTATFWSLTIPHFDGPDEEEHFNSVSRLLQGGGWPLPYEAPLLGSTGQAMREAGLPVEGEVLTEFVAPEDRATLGAATSLDDFGRDGMVHHPPGYYVLIAAGTAALGGETLRWDRASLVMRLLSAALLAGAVPFVIGSVRWVTGSATAGVGGGMGLFTVPFFTNMGGLMALPV